MSAASAAAGGSRAALDFPRSPRHEKGRRRRATLQSRSRDESLRFHWGARTSRMVWALKDRGQTSNRVGEVIKMTSSRDNVTP